MTEAELREQLETLLDAAVNMLKGDEMFARASLITAVHNAEQALKPEESDG